ncbi:PKD domain-containing protein [Flavobacterium faecale]|uniref:PKD domain-containing protein n=1 Tax=Flavobacterium faecale TaxID=1355330 RepID=A0A2S1LA22_9FLAO|nr:PKD domain-containing protein [Flavobacterium faecale]AWG20564.1 PKD domain-containing protein [Flavobacterium faecale]
MKPLFLLFYLTAFFTYAQPKVKDTITRRAIIGYLQTGSEVNFKPTLPPLIPISGAPKPSFSYLWEMGDGTYSRAAEPQHVYKNKGTYTARLAVTNNYDNGKPPATRPKKVVINEISSPPNSAVVSLDLDDNFMLQKNCDPIPSEEMVVIMSYQNPENYMTNGKLYLFYNETQFKNKNFELIDFRTHAGEREVHDNAYAIAQEINDSNRFLASNENSVAIKKNTNLLNDMDLETTLAIAKKDFHNVSILEMDDLNPNTQHNIFYTFKTTPEMLKDTSATVTMRGVFVPNRSYKSHKVKNLEMEIVTSHDPNKMGSTGSLMNYRFVRFKRVNFKTRFQNNGEGPARMIRLETDIPDMFDKKTFKIEDMYPKCPICPKDIVPTYSCLDTIIKQKQIHFTFKNIYLPGSTQKNVREKDSTKGFVKYSMKFNKDFHKTTTKSRTAIIFDKNDPILTNYATTRFSPGISIGAKAGYNYYPDLKKATSYFYGATISPFKSYRFYWQVELLNSFTNYESESSINDEIIRNAATIDQLQRTTTTSTNNTVNLEIPVLIRYNINNFVGIGAGLQVNGNLSEKQQLTSTIDLYEDQKPDFLFSTKEETSARSESFTNLKAGLLFDLTVGAARIGPSLGARYVVNFKESFNYLQFYGIWKF